MIPWRPIHTAPKDGSVVLAARLEDLASVLWVCRAFFEHGQWQLTEPRYNEPSHWLPVSAHGVGDGAELHDSLQKAHRICAAAARLVATLGYHGMIYSHSQVVTPLMEALDEYDGWDEDAPWWI